jgi:selenide,water dikinase
MGGVPLFALNLVAWPQDLLSLEILALVMDGGRSMSSEGDWVIAGGHTVDGPEPMYGQSVTGEVLVDELMTNAAASAGETLILTKPIGTGLIATAVKNCDEVAIVAGGKLHDSYVAAVREMTRLNDQAARIARTAGARAATDVTGFGLLGHLQKMAASSGVGAVVETTAVPILPGAWDLYDQGFIPGGTQRNLDYVSPWLGGDVDLRTKVMLADAQTSGGLLFGCAPEKAADALAALVDSGHDAAIVGQFVDEHAGTVRLT